MIPSPTYAFQWRACRGLVRRAEDSLPTLRCHLTRASPVFFCTLEQYVIQIPHDMVGTTLQNMNARSRMYRPDLFLVVRVPLVSLFFSLFLFLFFCHNTKSPSFLAAGFSKHFIQFKSYEYASGFLFCHQAVTPRRRGLVVHFVQCITSPSPCYAPFVPESCSLCTVMQRFIPGPAIVHPGPRLVEHSLSVDTQQPNHPLGAGDRIGF